MENTIYENIDRIRKKIPPSTRLVAVSKQASVDEIRAAYNAGARDFAENRLQNALLKQEQLQDLTDICWHFIGHIQTKKAKKIAENFSWIHSVDSLKLAQKLNNVIVEIASAPQVCLQVKVLPDPNKYGWSPTELLEDLASLDSLEYLQIRGLMAILPWGLSPAENLSAFKAVQALAEQIEQQKCSQIKMQELSMGMSGDYELAIQAGATMIRPGTTIFQK